MPVMMPALADATIAAATFQAHLDGLWASGRPERLGWSRRQLDALHVLVTLPATRPGGDADPFHFLLGAEYYDAAPPTVRLVDPSNLANAAPGSRWWPLLENMPPWFRLHEAYPWPDGRPRQLLCFSMNAEFYMTDHSPQPHELWVQGRHTVAMTLYRLAEILSPVFYRRPAA
jgi:hypothetical protein